MWNRRLAIATTRLLLTWSRAYILSGVPYKLCWVFGDLVSQKRSVRSHEPVMRLSEVKKTQHFQCWSNVEKKKVFSLVERTKVMDEMLSSCMPRLVTLSVDKSNLLELRIPWTLNYENITKVDVLFDNSIQTTTEGMCCICRERTSKNGCTMIKLGLGFGFLAPTVVNLIESHSLYTCINFVRDFVALDFGSPHPKQKPTVDVDS